MKFFLTAFAAVCAAFYASACCYNPPGPIINWRNSSDFFNDTVSHADCSGAVLEELKDSPFENRYAQYAQLLSAEQNAVFDLGESYAAYRKEFDEYMSRRADSYSPDSVEARQPAKERFFAKIPRGLAEEFALYERGAVCYKLKLYDEAREYFEAVLALDESVRPHKTVEAQYMLARSLHKEGRRAEARDAYAKVAELYRKGFKSRENLTSSCMGFDAQTYVQDKNYVEGFYRYFSIYRLTGEDLGIGFTVKRGVSDGAYEEFAEDENLYKFVCAYADNMGGNMTPKVDALWNRWLDAMEGRGRKIWKFGGTMAMNAYSRGNFELAKRCVEMSDPHEPLARWISAKMKLMEGDADGASEIFADLLKYYSNFGTPYMEKASLLGWAGSVRRSNPYFGILLLTEHLSPRSKILAEYGILLFDKSDLNGALDCFLEAHRYVDAAFVCEIAMTLGELMEYADARLDDFSDGADFARASLVLRLLAEGKTDAVRKYYAANPENAEYIKFLDRFLAALREGRDESLPRNERAAALWEAFSLYMYGGFNFFREVHRPLRYPGEATDYYAGTENAYMSTGKGEDSGGRADTPATRLINERKPLFTADKSMRYRAFELGLEAADLFEGDADLKARMYIACADRMKIRNPRNADRAYKALVRNCKGSELAAQADKNRWFPKIDITWQDVREDLAASLSREIPPAFWDE